MAPQDEPARLASLVERLATRSDIPHAVVAVEQVHGAFRWSHTAGRADESGTPMRSETPYFLASIDKLYTATLILKLEERGRLDLDQPMAACLPASLCRGLHRLHGTDHTGAVTVRHLLAHASGLADWLEDRPRGGPSLVDRLQHEGDRAWSLDDIARYVRDELVPHFPPQPLAGRGRIRYSDTNYMLLAGILETLTGEPLHHLHRTMLYEPLGLRHTWMAGHSRPIEPTAEPAALWAGARTIDIPLMMRSFRGMYANARTRAPRAHGCSTAPTATCCWRARWTRSPPGWCPSASCRSCSGSWPESPDGPLGDG